MKHTKLQCDKASNLQMTKIFGMSSVIKGCTPLRTGTPRISRRRQCQILPPVALHAAERGTASDKVDKIPLKNAALSKFAWPCRNGQLLRVVQAATDGGNSVQVTLEGLAEGQEADLLW